MIYIPIVIKNSKLSCIKVIKQLNLNTIKTYMYNDLSEYFWKTLNCHIYPSEINQFKLGFEFSTRAKSLEGGLYHLPVSNASFSLDIIYNDRRSRIKGLQTYSADPMCLKNSAQLA